MRRALRFSVSASLVGATLSLLGCDLVSNWSKEQAPPLAATPTPEPKQRPKQAKQAPKRTAKAAPQAKAPDAPEETIEPGDSAEPEPAEATVAASSSEPESETCPEDMVLVSGGYCRNVEERCLEYVMDIEGSPDKSRCKRFAEPTVCTDKQPRREMRFCMDRYEWPNKKGEIPHTLVSWEEAARSCNAVGKRLCTESEFTFACEGEQMQPHATGFVRDDKKCNIDRDWLKRRKEMKPRLQCEVDAVCKAEMDRLDGREASGAREECVSPFGAYDLNGNVNEWVSMPWKGPGKRSAIKGGWWGPVRNRCRPIVQSHGETYIGYEVGFRCCDNADRKDRTALGPEAPPSSPEPAAKLAPAAAKERPAASQRPGTQPAAASGTGVGRTAQLQAE